MVFIKLFADMLERLVRIFTGKVYGNLTGFNKTFLSGIRSDLTLGDGKLPAYHLFNKIHCDTLFGFTDVGKNAFCKLKVNVASHECALCGNAI